ncbi:MAG: enoyl-CoA hydratase/isomerase family protein [Acidobacteriaceae bacterium]|nr:enoyl-CoA hydratase/isomerase family protein [Acidobacteriaceae bacterium]MBV9038451.1 enoyl-CoA hydratase/isomerase family protein [Acidobacteriaceae bacterium]MBV9224286.1 enoyl-CoA hydratase/isomerase family protein [Acidobacteriaceae bacterium]MBV9304554.1 enoyl-CoA hydratase/isomerase family protein [Acidobacteriaceae bacterium]MBV9675831.1 enoyl-CoA hydratase/isomerase family protein [Acidobacteriaceae bacterium]
MNSVIHLQRLSPGIGIVKLEDRVSRNTFSRAFVEGLCNVFAEIARDTSLRVIVVQGYDSYFCCGGTKEELLTITEGKLQFTDSNFFDLLIQCELPVIAAMQGHALGGGLAFGAFADILVMAEEAIYSANFMRYGFTPGMGATYIIPRKFGETLGSEMLFTALGYHGGELRQRGAGARIVSRDQVATTALSIARELADKPRATLLQLKQHLAAPIREALPKVVERELAMHRITFAQPEVRERIETLFGN